jgi:RsiW-degrading membrane proteinase PrsW (M82 family)
MSPRVKAILLSLPLAVSLGWLCLDGPIPFAREAWFVVVCCGLTFITRTVTWRAAVFGLSLGIGLAAPAMVAVGWLLASSGLDVSDSVFGSWVVVPITEEVIKLAPVFVTAWLHRRRTGLTFNPSDWLLVGCAVGAGFAMVENAELVRANPGVLRDMAQQYGPSWLVPGAWGDAGYVGHAAATGMAAAGVGLSVAFGRMAGVAAVPAWARWVALGVPAGWVTLEHALANLYVNTGSSVALLLGNGRLTPWLFLATVALAVALDRSRMVKALSHSRTLRVRQTMVREAFLGSRTAINRPWWQRCIMAGDELRLVNMTAWLTLERLERTTP